MPGRAPRVGAENAGRRRSRSIASALRPGQETGGAEMVLHETESGGAVFSVGSITYPCSLLVDTNISKVTLNVVRKFLG